MSSKPPAFQFYVNDWLSSPEIMLMTAAEEGAYIRLLAISWAKGGIPDDDKQLAILSRLGEGWFKGSSTKIRACFVKRGGKLVNKRLEKERKNNKTWREKCRQGGIASGKARKNKGLGQKNTSTTLQLPHELKGNTSTSTSTSTTTSVKRLTVNKSTLLKKVKGKDYSRYLKWFTDEFEVKTRNEKRAFRSYAKLCLAISMINGEDWKQEFNTWLTESVIDIKERVKIEKIPYPGANKMFSKTLSNKIGSLEIK